MSITLVMAELIWGLGILEKEGLWSRYSCKCTVTRCCEGPCTRASIGHRGRTVPNPLNLATSTKGERELAGHRLWW